MGETVSGHLVVRCDTALYTITAEGKKVRVGAELKEPTTTIVHRSEDRAMVLAGDFMRKGAYEVNLVTGDAVELMAPVVKDVAYVGDDHVLVFRGAERRLDLFRHDGMKPLSSPDATAELAEEFWNAHMLRGGQYVLVEGTNEPPFKGHVYAVERDEGGPASFRLVGTLKPPNKKVPKTLSPGDGVIEQDDKIYLVAWMTRGAMVLEMPPLD